MFAEAPKERTIVVCLTQVVLLIVLLTELAQATEQNLNNDPEVTQRASNFIDQAQTSSRTRIGIVDMQMVFRESNLGKHNEKHFKQIYANIQTRLEGQKKEIAKLEKDINFSGLSENGTPGVNDPLVTLERLVKKLNDDSSQIEKKFQEDILKSRGRFYKTLRETLIKFARKEHFTIILDKNDIDPMQQTPLVLFATSSVDITNRVVSELDAATVGNF